MPKPTSLVFNDLEEWLIYARGYTSVHSEQSWRTKALVVILAVVEQHRQKSATELLGTLRKAYPFGERKMYPYKAWLNEISNLKTALLDKDKSWEEFGVWEVAGDLLEMGREEEAKALLESDAPNRHGRACPSCGRSRARPCREPIVENADDLPQPPQTDLFTSTDKPYRGALGVGPQTRFIDRVLPCRARVEPTTPRSTP